MANKQHKEETAEEYRKRIASLGGQATVKKYGKKHMAAIHKKGLEKRWGKKRRGKLSKILFD